MANMINESLQELDLSYGLSQCDQVLEFLDASPDKVTPLLRANVLRMKALATELKNPVTKESLSDVWIRFKENKA